MLSAAMALALLPGTAFAAEQEAGVKAYANPVIQGAVAQINDKIGEKGGYAVLSQFEETDEGGGITVTIIDNDYPLVGDYENAYGIARGTGAYADIFGTLVNVLYDVGYVKGEQKIVRVKAERGNNIAFSTSSSKVEFSGKTTDAGVLIKSYYEFASFIRGMYVYYKDRLGDLAGKTLIFRAYGEGDEETALYATYNVTFVPHEEKLTYHKAVAPTCTEAGTKEYYECSVCGKKFADENAREVLTDIVVNATGHELSKYDAKDATCTEDGNVAYYECSICKEKFEDEDAQIKIAHDTVLKATGHRWDEWVKKTGYMIRICKTCGVDEIKSDEPETPADETPATETPATETPATETPATEAPAQTPATEAPTATVTPSIETPATETAVVTPAVTTPKKVAMKTGQSTTKIQIPVAQGDKIVSVKSGNKKIAKVKVLKNGKIKVKAKQKTGTVKIKVKLASGKTVKFKVKVQKNPVKTTKITAPAKLNLQVGETAALNAKITPVTSLEGIAYKSSNPKVAKVSKKGVVTGRKKGTAKITITSGSKKAVCTVNVG